jgi:hypothetical protein
MENIDPAPSPDNTDGTEFLKRIDQYVRDAEKHMALADGTISGTFDDSDFLFVVKICAVLEPLLKEAVREHVRRSMARILNFDPTSSDTLIKEIGELGNDKLRKILVEFKAIDGGLSGFLDGLFQVRNRYAHHIGNAHLSILEVCDKVAAEGGDAKLIEKLVALGPISRDELEPERLRAIMFFNIASVLAAAVHLAKPPPLPSGVLFGSMPLTLREQPPS